MIIYSAGVIGFEVDLVVLQGFVHKTYPSLLSPFVLTANVDPQDFTY